MTRSLRSVWHRRRTAVLLATATIAASFGWALAPTSSSAQTADPPFTVELSQTTGLLDGDVVKVTIRGAPGVQLNPGSSSMRVCRPGVSYTAPADLIPTNGKCPANGTSSAAEASGQIFAIADGTRAEGDIAVGVGVGEWEVFGQPNFTLACGPGAPCLLVLQVGTTDSVGGPITRHFVTRELTFADPDPTRGCGGRNPAAVSTAASDRMQDIWARSTLAQCTSGGASGASTSFAPTGEGEGIAAFTAGTRDLVYTAAGYRPFLGLDPAPRRPAVYTPVALNAVVIAAIGGQLVNDDPQWPVGLAKPYSEPIRMTAAEAATLLGQGGFFFNSTPGIGPEFLARNPQIGPTAYNPNDRFANAAAVQDATAVSLFATSFLDEQAPGHWVSRPDVQARSRGVDAQLARAVPGFESSLTPVSQKIQTFAFRNGVQQNATTPGPGWALTDYATAIDLGLTPVAIQNAAGEFVEPTPESIAAGVATMTKESDGRRVPDPDTTASGAYPMAMIEYAMAPAEQLVDQTCAPRAESQQVLTSWLSFLTGAGQDALAPDFVPLTPELAAEAQEKFAQIGASPSTAGCAPANPGGPGGPGGTTPASVAAPTGGTGSGTSGFGAGSGSGAGSGAGADAGAGALSGSTPDELAGAEELAEAAEPTLPPFLGIAAVSEIISPLALLLVVVLTSGAAFLTSGRPAPPALASGAAPGQGGGRQRGAPPPVATPSLTSQHRRSPPASHMNVRCRSFNSSITACDGPMSQPGMSEVFRSPSSWRSGAFTWACDKTVAVVTAAVCHRPLGRH